MGTDICPSCGTIVQETDSHCMDCGADLAEARRKVREKSLVERGGIVVADPVVVVCHVTLESIDVDGRS